MHMRMQCTAFSPSLQSDCSGLPISKCSPASFIQGRIYPQWLISKGDRQMLQRSNFKIRLLVCCDGLEWDTSRFRGGERSPTCKLCALLRTRCTSYWSAQLSRAPQKCCYQGASLTLSAYTSSPNLLINYLLGTSWLDDLPNTKIRSELHTRATKSPCRPNNRTVIA